MARSRSTRPGPLAFALVGAALAVVVPTFAPASVGLGLAWAQEKPLAKEDFNLRIQRRDGDSWVNLSASEAETHFNAARCRCKDPIRIIAELTASGSAKKGNVTQGSLRMFVGTNCLDKSNPTERDKRCQELGSATELTAFTRSSFVVETTANVFVTPKTGACDAKRIDQTIALWVDFDPNDDPDLTDAAAPIWSMVVDTEPPKEPEMKSVAGGNEALILSWEASTTTMDLAGYQVFCSRGEDLVVFPDGTYDDRVYETQQTLCPSSGSMVEAGPEPVVYSGDAPTSEVVRDRRRTLAVGDDAGSSAGPDAGVFPAFGAFSTLDARYMCSNHLATTQTSTRISILQNGIAYLAGVVAVDRHGNPSPLTRVYLQTPVPSKDFYRGLCETHRADGQTEPCPSGCALTAPTTTDDGFGPTDVAAAGAALTALATLLGLRRRRRRP